MTQNITDTTMKRSPVRGDTIGDNFTADFIADRVALSELELLKSVKSKRKTKISLSIHHKKFVNALLISLDYDTQKNKREFFRVSDVALL